MGDGSRARLRLTDYQAYARNARRRLEDVVENPAPTRPIPCADCALCRWGDHCESVWQAEDSLFNVANIPRPQVKKLEAAGIRTMEALAGHDHPVRARTETTRPRLVTRPEARRAGKAGGSRCMSGGLTHP